MIDTGPGISSKSGKSDRFQTICLHFFSNKFSLFLLSMDSLRPKLHAWGAPMIYFLFLNSWPRYLFDIEFLSMTSLSSIFKVMKFCKIIESCVNRTIPSDVISGRFWCQRMLKKLHNQDFGLNFQIKKTFWDLHLYSARYEQYKVPYFSIFKLKNLGKWKSLRPKKSSLD